MSQLPFWKRLDAAIQTVAVTSSVCFRVLTSMICGCSKKDALAECTEDQDGSVQHSIMCAATTRSYSVAASRYGSRLRENWRDGNHRRYHMLGGSRGYGEQ